MGTPLDSPTAALLDFLRVKGYEIRPYGEAWELRAEPLHAPTHWYKYTLANLENLAGKFGYQTGTVPPGEPQR